jgi:hypothetical protein
MLKDLYQKATSLTKSALYLKQGKYRKAAEALGIDFRNGRRWKDLANSGSAGLAKLHLAWIFGAAPVLNDMEHTMSEVGKAMSEGSLKTIRSTAAEVLPYQHTNGFTESGKVEEICEVGYILAIKPAYFSAFLGLSNPLATAWELVPLSFVINWILSVGDILTALGAGVGVEVIAGYETRVVKGNRILTLPYNGGDEVIDYDIFTMERRKLQAIAIPGLYAKWTIGNGQLLTAAVLLRAIK